MSSEVLVVPLQANVPAKLGWGSILNLFQATSPVTVTFNYGVAVKGRPQTAMKKLTNVPAGTKFTANKQDGPWQTVDIVSTVNQNIQVFIGDDDCQFNQAVTVTGTATVATLPSATITDTPLVVSAVGQKALFPANAGRRRITVYSDPANANNTVIYFRKTGGANNIGFIVPGTFEEFDTTAGLDIQAAAAGDNLYLFEES